MSIEEEQEVKEPIHIEDLKKQLEVEKLQKEIRQLDFENNRKWFRKPQWIAALSPIALGILTLIVAFASGLIQNQSTLNKIQEENFIQRKKLIIDSIAQLRGKYDSLSFRLDNLSLQKEYLDSQVIELQSVKDTLFTKFTQTGTRLDFMTKKYFANLNELNSLKISFSKLNNEHLNVIKESSPGCAY